MTYGWAILIIVIVAAVLYSLGIFNPASSVSATVSGFSGFEAQATCIKGAFVLQLTNGLGSLINVTEINYTTTSGRSVTEHFAKIIPPQQSNIYPLPSSCSSSAGSKSSTPAYITYTEPGQVFPGPYVSSGTVQGAGGSQGKVASLSGSTYANSSYIGSAIGSQVTLVAWINPYTGNGGPDRSGQVIWYGPTPVSCQRVASLGFDGSTDTTYVSLWCGGDGEYTGAVPASINSWSFIAATINGTGVNLYVNNQNSSGTVISGLLSVPSGSVAWIGTNNPNNPGYSPFIGKIADIQIYNGVLSKTQILSLYAEGFGGGPLASANLIGWWPLNGNVNDYSGNAYNGVSTGVQWASP